MTIRHSATLAAVLLIAAGGFSGLQEPGYDHPEVPTGTTANASESQQFSAALIEAQAVLRSPEFRANLLSLQTVYPRVHFRTAPDGASLVSGEVGELASMLSGGQAGHRYVRTPFSLTGQSNEYTPVSAGRAGTDVDADGVARGSAQIARGHLWNWNHSNDVIRSCAINTIAHEISHTLVIDTATYRHSLTDFDRFSAPAGVPSGSYLVGTVAQCTWLQQKGRIAATGFGACVTTFGTRHFNSARCQQFYPGDLVAVHPGLSPAATDEEMRS